MQKSSTHYCNDCMKIIPVDKPLCFKHQHELDVQDANGAWRRTLLNDFNPKSPVSLGGIVNQFLSGDAYEETNLTFELKVGSITFIARLPKGMTVKEVAKLQKFTHTILEYNTVRSMENDDA